MPFLGFSQNKFNTELIKIFSRFIPSHRLNIAPSNPLSISSLFKFKDSLPVDMRSKVVYNYTCPKCTLGSNYIGCTERPLRVRIDCHRGVSYRTGLPLKTKEHSNIRHHAIKCGVLIQPSDFKILASCKDRQSMLIIESILIKTKSPSLNVDNTSVPLHLA